MSKKPRRIVKGTLNPKTQAVRDAYFKYKEEHPEPTPWNQLTPLQQRMQIETEIQLGIYDPNKVRD